MGKTYRKEPTHLLRKPKHINRRRSEASVLDDVKEYPIKKQNRITSAQSRIVDDWDDQYVSEYRGQSWHRK